MLSGLIRRLFGRLTSVHGASNPAHAEALSQIDLLVAAEQGALKKTIEILPAFSFFHGHLLQYLFWREPRGGNIFTQDTGSIEFYVLRDQYAPMRIFSDKISRIIRGLTEPERKSFQSMGITVDNAEKYYQYATGWNVQELARAKCNCAFSLGCFYNLEVIEFNDIEHPFYPVLGDQEEDHSRPSSHGGTDNQSNLQRMCTYHNIVMKNANPLFDCETLHAMFFGD